MISKMQLVPSTEDSWPFMTAENTCELKKYGYVDIYGNIAIKPTFSSASPFRNGLAHVQVSDGKFALDEFIDTNGKVVFKAPKRTKDRYYGLDDTWMGDYVVVEIWTLKNNVIDPLGYNYADIKGKMLTSEVYTYVGPFSEGYALVGTGSATGHRSRNSNEQNEHWNSTKNGNVAKTYFYIDQQGNQLECLVHDLIDPLHHRHQHHQILVLAVSCV